LTFIPVALALIVGAQAGAHVIGRVGARMVAASGLIVAALGLAYLARMPAEANVVVDVLPGFVLAAAGLGPTFMAATTAAFGRSDQRDAGMTSGLVNTAHELGFGLGVAVLSTIAGASLAGAGSLVGGFQTAFLAGAVAAIVAAGLAIALLPAEKLTPPPGFAH
jgi:MFS family permease